MKNGRQPSVDGGAFSFAWLSARGRTLVGRPVHFDGANRSVTVAALLSPARQQGGYTAEGITGTVY